MLINAIDGNFYGATDRTVFRITPAGVITTLYTFAGSPGSLTQGTDGNIYGTTQNDGANNRGTLFELTPSGTIAELYSFPSSPLAGGVGVIQARDGNFYGTTSQGGTFNRGSFFELVVK